jgi:hypothetical protein
MCRFDIQNVETNANIKIVKQSGNLKKLILIPHITVKTNKTPTIKLTTNNLKPILTTNPKINKIIKQPPTKTSLITQQPKTKITSKSYR